MMKPGRYYFECESPRGRAATDYRVVAKGDGVDLKTLIVAMEKHLGTRKTPMGG